MLSTPQLYRSNNQPANYAALTQFAPEPSHGGEHRILLPSIKRGGGERKEPCPAGRRKIVLDRPWSPCLRQSAVDAFGFPRPAGARRRGLCFSEHGRLPD